MKTSRLFPSLLLAAAVAGLLLPAARAAENETTAIKFSDPAKPGTLKITVTNGDIHLRGADTAEVSVTTDLKPETPVVRQDGLRVLTSSSSYSLTEKNNTVTLSYGTEGWPASGGDFTITVPRTTAIIINTNLGGDVEIGGVNGNLEVKSLNGDVHLNDIAGAALVETVNGEIHATVRELTDGQPLSFTSMNGEVALHLPADAKANVRLRTHNGSILTDFDDKALVTKTESLRVSRHSRAPRAPGDSTDLRTAMHEAALEGAAAMHEAAAAIKEAAIAAREASHASQGDNEDTPPALIAPLAPLPPMTGGKIVTGTLNGGGPEIRIATMNGDVTLRKIAPKK